MVQLTPYEKAPNDPSYMGYSKEFDSPKPNETISTAIKSLTNFGDLAVKAVDQTIKQTTEDELGDKLTLNRESDVSAGKSLLFDTESALGLSGAKASSITTTPLPAGQAFASSGEADVPVPIEQGIQKQLKMQQALKLGKVSDVDYYGSAAAITQNLVSRYPGYREYITDKATKILGKNPFNAEREAVQASLLQLYNQRDASEKSWDSFLISHGKYLGEKNVEAARNITDIQTRNNIKAFVAGQQASEHQMDLAMKQTQASIANNKLTGEEVDRTIGTVSDTILTNSFNAMYQGKSGFSGSLNDVNKYLAQGLRNGETPDPEVLKTLGGIVGQAKMGALAAFDKAMISPQWTGTLQPTTVAEAAVRGSDALSLTAMRRDPNKIGEARKQLASYYDMIESQIGSGYTKLASASEAFIATSRDNATLRMIGLPYIAQTMGLEGALKNSAAGVINGLNTLDGWKTMSQTMQAVSQMGVVGSVASGDKDGGLYTQIIGRYKQIAAAATAEKPPAEPTPAENRAHIAILKEYLTSKGASLETKINVANVLSNPTETLDYIKYFNKDQTFAIWSDIYSPEVTAEVKKLGPEAWNRYAKTGTRIFKNLFGTTIDSFNEVSEAQKRAIRNLEIKFNPDSQQFVYKGQDNVPTSPFDITLPKGPVPTAIDRLNIGLRTYTNILKQDGLKLTPELLNAIGINTGQETDSEAANRLLKELSKIPVKGSTSTQKPQKQSNLSLQELQQQAVTVDGNQYVNLDGQWHKLTVTR